jgi:hypothetical protein
MKRNRRKTFAYRPSDRIVSRESIISVGYYLLLLGSVKTGGTSGVLSGAVGWILTALAALGLYLGVRSMENTAAVMKWKIIGLVCNGIVLAVSIIVFVIGLITMI